MTKLAGLLRKAMIINMLIDNNNKNRGNKINYLNTIRVKITTVLLGNSNSNPESNSLSVTQEMNNSSLATMPM